LIVLALLVGGCASSAMRPVGPGAAAAPLADKAVVVFMRPSNFGGAIQASVFDVTQPSNHTDKFVGIVSAGTKVAYVADAGPHLFMVIGENADFMDATLAPGKTYHAIVSARMGWWKARFSLEPVHAAELTSADFAEWNETKLVENTTESHAWAKDNWESIQGKKVDYIRKWNAKPQAERDEQTLFVQDGR
jgi:hypothetical protein